MKLFSLPSLIFLAGIMSASAQTPASPAKPAPAKSAPAKPAPSKPAVTPTAPSDPAVVAADAVVLTIGDEKITKAQYEALLAALPEQMRASANGPNKRKFVEQLVEMKTLAYEARRRKIDQTPEAKQLIALQVDNALAAELFKDLNAGVKVDDAAAHAYYDQHKSEYEEAKASHILIRFKGSPVPLKPEQKDLTEEEALAKAKAIREKLAAGADFATVAKAESDDAGSGANGGSLGSFGHGRMVPVFDQAVFSLPIGQLSEPVKSQFGYHIIRVDERTAKTFDAAKPEIEAKMKPEAARKAIDDVKKTVPVAISDTYFGK